MTAVDDSTRVLVGAGAVGTQLHHRNHFEAAADAVEAKCVRLQSS
ncbi:hypothetical protein [[Mycobacterium] appelbergii]|nr:hypothetical protein [Mycobacterium sp. 21AC1]